MAQPDPTPPLTAAPHDPIADRARRERVHQQLLSWYAAAGRDLPWRHTRDPYAILVSEVMLQQTQVERVLPKYREFLARFPTLAALAAAPAADVIRAWAPLGYNVRAVRLQQIARQAVAEHGGRLPATLDGLLGLKGIGRYTAGAIACFAFGLPVATVDTNIRRTLWRVFRGIEPSAWPTGQAAARHALALAEWALPPQHAYDWQQALMDLGATVCTSRKPACERCPLAESCAALAEARAVALFPSGEAIARLRDARDPAAPERPTPDVRLVAEQRAPYSADLSSPDQASGPAQKRRRAQPAQPFTTTSRYFRGRVLAALRDLPPGASLPLASLGPLVKPDWQPGDTPWLRGIVTGLARDGLIRLVPAPGASAADESAAEEPDHVALP
jgi:A/G-specific adenine glycosylase